MKQQRLVLVLALALAGSVGCEKSGGFSAKGSGKLTADENTLLSHLPAGNTGLFGGNYMKLQKYMQSSPMASMMSALNKQTPGVVEWTNCFVDLPNLSLLGAVKIGDKAEMAFVTKGLTIDQVEGCAKRASFPSTVDPDKKFIGFEMESAMGAIKTGYLVLADGTLYTRQAFPLGGAMGGGAAMISVDRATLETEAAAIAKANASQDTALIAELDHVDRSKAMWFVGSGARTAIADKLGLVYGTIDIGNGMAFDITAEVKDKGIADKISEGVPEMKKQASSMPGGLGPIVESLQFSRSGDKLRFGLKLTDEQLSTLFKSMGAMMGGGL